MSSPNSSSRSPARSSIQRPTSACARARRALGTIANELTVRGSHRTAIIENTGAAIAAAIGDGQVGQRESDIGVHIEHAHSTISAYRYLVPTGVKYRVLINRNGIAECDYAIASKRDRSSPGHGRSQVCLCALRHYWEKHVEHGG